MRFQNIAPRSLLFATTIVLLAACASARSTPPTLSFTVGSLTGSNPTLFSFSESNGGWPYDLLYSNGTFYGTTSTGGHTGNCDVSSGCGIVYSISPGGSEATVYEFKGPPDGGLPAGGLIMVDKTLYGTTEFGGKVKDCDTSVGCGTVFSITASGKEHVIHTFSGSEGNRPAAGVIAVGDTLYGTTSLGGTHGEGTVFSTTTTGRTRVLYNFGDKDSDAQQPDSPLLYFHGMLYGTTPLGGTAMHCSSGSYATCGTVFSVTLAGKENILHNFAGAPDGIGPNGGLIAVDGVMYGTTSAGGTKYYNCGRPHGNCGGTVYSITPTGNESVIYSFYKNFGVQPVSQLLNLKGVLYGVTAAGGRHGLGTVFALSSGKEHVLYSFAKADHGGRVPNAVTAWNGTLYGTTLYGGDDNWGTVFSLKP